MTSAPDGPPAPSGSDALPGQEQDASRAPRPDPPGPGRPPGPDLEVGVDSTLTEAGRALRAPRAAGIAGIAFAILFSVGLFMVRSVPLASMSDAQIAAWFASGADTAIVVGGLYLLPFSGVAFLWFVAVVRDQIGEREDRFFATVFFGSGLLFVALLFAGSAVLSSLVVGVRFLDQPAPSAATVALIRSLAYTMVFAFGTRAAAVFLLSTATVGLRSRTFPRWLALSGYLIGLVLITVVSFWDWIILVLPAWVALVSVVILARERSRRA